MSTLTETAVDATLDVTAELTWVEQQLQLRDRLLATTAAKLGEAQKANAAWRVVLRRWLPTECEAPGDGRACREYLERAEWCRGCEIKAALADPNPGADYVPRADYLRACEKLGRALTDHQAELRRVAKAVREACQRWLPRDSCECLDDIDLDALVRGDK
jgi:hypothetical protein